MLRGLHKKYGTKFVLNIYFTTADEFDLTKFPDRYRSEWRDNANWLKLAFHAHANEPANPYIDAPPEQLIADFDKVREQISSLPRGDLFTDDDCGLGLVGRRVETAGRRACENPQCYFE